MEYLTLKDGRKVKKADYIMSKTTELRNCGNPFIEEINVEFELNKVLYYNDCKLTIVGQSIKEDILL